MGKGHFLRRGASTKIRHEFLHGRKSPHISRRFHDFISDLPWVLQSNFYRRVPQINKTPLQIAHYPPGIAEQLFIDEYPRLKKPLFMN